MALIKCPECNHDVSTLAESCPHCGCPTSAMGGAIDGNVRCEILGKQYDLSSVLALVQAGEKIKAIKLARETTGLGLAESNHLVEEIISNNCQVPKKSSVTSNVRDNLPKCPTCGSTDLTKIGAGTRAIDGFFFGRLSVEGRAQWRCNKCSHIW